MSRQRSTPRKVKNKPGKIKSLAELTMVHPHAAGLDIGAHETWACVPLSSSPEPVRVFGPFTPDLHAALHGSDTAAGEAGVETSFMTARRAFPIRGAGNGRRCPRPLRRR